MVITRRVNTLVGPAFALFVIFGIVLVADAATITVNSLADPGASGNCVLRDAITASNTEAAVNGCAAGSGNDTIVFSVTGTIAIGSSLPNIVNTLTIEGPTATPPVITIDGANKYQVMVVNSGATLNADYLTITHGFSSNAEGGGIQSDGSLNVTNSTLSGNSATD